MAWQDQPRDELGRWVAREVGEAMGWGEGELASGEPSEERGPSSHSMDVGNGHSLQLDPEQITEMLRSPEVLEILEAHGKSLAKLANELATTEGADYTYTLQVNEGYETPQIFLHPNNFAAKIDDAAHSTLLKVAATVNDDVPIEVGEEDIEEVWVPVSEPSFEDYALPRDRTIWSKAAGR